MLREFLDSVLSEIDSESLTDDEYNALPEGLQEEYSKATYEALKAIVQEREGVSGALKRLQAYFTAKGADLSATAARTPASQIIVGFALD